MTSDQLKDAIAELKGLVSCRCNDAYLGRKLKDPDCNCDSVPAVSLVSDYIENLEAELWKVRQERNHANDVTDAAIGRIEALDVELRDTKSRLQELTGDKINLRSELIMVKSKLEKAVDALRFYADSDCTILAQLTSDT